MPMISPPSRISAASAFSLVEVCLAIGVVSFSLLAVLGLLPIGLTTMRGAMDSTIERNIVQQLTAEALQTPYARLTNVFQADRERYFDNQGLVLSGPANARYTAVISPGQTEFPGSANADFESSMRTLHIRISTLGAATNHYNILIANSGNE